MSSPPGALETQAEVTIRQRDPSGTAVGEVKVGKLDVGPMMLRAGMAWYVKEETDSPIYAKSEEAARKAKRGLWHDEGAVAPWVWRDKSATPASEPATPEAPGIAMVPQPVADEPPSTRRRPVLAQHPERRPPQPLLRVLQQHQPGPLLHEKRRKTLRLLRRLSCL